jgi:hypothetical protein
VLFGSRSALLPLALSFASISGSGLCQTLISERGPFTWTEPCTGGTIEITLRVYKNVPEYPGLYKWDYEVHNISLHSGPYYQRWTDGFGMLAFKLAGDREGADLGNWEVPSQWVANAVDGVTLQAGMEGLPEGCCGAFQVNPLGAGETAHFRFTSAPRRIGSLQACPITSDGVPDTSASCGWGMAAYAAIVAKIWQTDGLYQNAKSGPQPLPTLAGARGSDGARQCPMLMRARAQEIAAVFGSVSDGGFGFRSWARVGTAFLDRGAWRSAARL